MTETQEPATVSSPSRIPRWLRPLVQADRWHEDGGPRKTRPLRPVTDEDVQSAIAKFTASLARSARTINTVRTRQFLEELPSTPPAPPDAAPVWHPTTEPLPVEPSPWHPVTGEDMSAGEATC